MSAGLHHLKLVISEADAVALGLAERFATHGEATECAPFSHVTRDTSQHKVAVNAEAGDSGTRRGMSERQRSGVAGAGAATPSAACANMPVEPATTPTTPVSASWRRELSFLELEEMIPGGDDLDDEATTTVAIHSGNPAVEIREGLLRLFRDVSECGDGDAAVSVQALPEGRTRVVCVLAIPTHVTASDFLCFCGAFTAHLEHVRVIRDASPARYMALLTFDSQNSADAFHCSYNGRRFNNLEPETAQVLFVASLELLVEEGDAEESVFDASFDGLAELPTCAVCLDRMDATVTGLMTMQCAHSFHMRCLARWADSSCPVCRFSIESPDQGSLCLECRTHDNLWICLVCGFIGCGRYASRHAFLHFQNKGHRFSMELETQRVWDYVGDEYVHRVIQTKSGGKLVELPDPHAVLGGDDTALLAGDGSVSALKIEAIAQEFSHLLHTQLESQRLYFEQQLQQLENTRRLEVAEAQARLRAKEKEREEMRRELKRARKQAAHVARETAFVKEVNEALQGTQAHFAAREEAMRGEYEAKLAAKDAEMAGMSEMIRDLMASLEFAQRSREAGAVGGDVMLVHPSDAADVLAQNDTASDVKQQIKAAKKRRRTGGRRRRRG